MIEILFILTAIIIFLLLAKVLLKKINTQDSKIDKIIKNRKINHLSSAEDVSNTSFSPMGGVSINPPFRSSKGFSHFEDTSSKSQSLGFNPKKSIEGLKKKLSLNRSLILGLTSIEESQIENEFDTLIRLNKAISSAKKSIRILSQLNWSKSTPFRECYPTYLVTIENMISQNPSLECSRIFQLTLHVKPKDGLEAIKIMVGSLNSLTIEHLITCFKTPNQFKLYILEKFLTEGYIIIDDEKLIHKELIYNSGKQNLKTFEVFAKNSQDRKTFDIGHCSYKYKIKGKSPISVLDFIGVFEEMMSEDQLLREIHGPSIKNLRKVINYQESSSSIVSPFSGRKEEFKTILETYARVEGIPLENKED